ncbi:type 1 periplasmic-binding domain-containing protein [Streptomyces sp. ME109]|uniref:hypothetical protein n=1 Tax=Streptomyces sp. me109 TaxID=1827853 RepID=UPI0021C90E42|nr:hypothetical protein [Streptomyces sp. me109]
MSRLFRRGLLALAAAVFTLLCAGGPAVAHGFSSTVYVHVSEADGGRLRTAVDVEYDLFVVSAADSGHDGPTNTLVTAVRSWADAEGLSLRTVTASDASDLVPGITRALDMRPDLVISAGNDLVDPLAMVTPNHLAQQFLVVGAELAEPTANVTAVDWSGASFRGEGLGMSSTYDARSFTDRRCSAAVRAGVAAVLHGLTGIVLWLDQV